MLSFQSEKQLTHDCVPPPFPSGIGVSFTEKRLTFVLCHDLTQPGSDNSAVFVIRALFQLRNERWKHRNEQISPNTIHYITSLTRSFRVSLSQTVSRSSSVIGCVKVLVTVLGSPPSWKCYLLKQSELSLTLNHPTKRYVKINPTTTRKDTSKYQRPRAQLVRSISVRLIENNCTGRKPTFLRRN